MFVSFTTKVYLVVNQAETVALLGLLGVYLRFLCVYCDLLVAQLWCVVLFSRGAECLVVPCIPGRSGSGRFWRRSWSNLSAPSAGGTRAVGQVFGVLRCLRRSASCTRQVAISDLHAYCYRLDK